MEKVAWFPSSDFIAKNQLSREGSQSVSPLTIPALTSIVDRQFKEDGTLCPVGALRYYLDRTKDLRGSQSILFIALIHPIQWTIANPVGTDRPAKRQKKTSCVSTGWCQTHGGGITAETGRYVNFS